MTAKYDPAEAARLAAEASEDDERLQSRGDGSWYASHEGRVYALADGVSLTVCSVRGGEPRPQAAALARTRNNLCAISDQLHAAMAEIDRLSRDLDEATHVIERLCDAAGQTLHGNSEPLFQAVDLAVRFVSAGPAAPVDVLRAVEQDEIEVVPVAAKHGIAGAAAWHRPTGVAMVVMSPAGSGQHARELAVSRLKILLAEATTAWRER